MAGEDALLLPIRNLISVVKADVRHVINDIKTITKQQTKVEHVEKAAEIQGDLLNDVVNNIQRIGDPSRKEVVEEAKRSQGNEDYPGVDSWSATTIKRGTIIYQGAGGTSNFFSDHDTVTSAGGSIAKYYESLQMKVNKSFGYRKGVTAYKATRDITTATSTVKQNTQYGSGGGKQYYLPKDYNKSLEPVYSIPLK